jgi:glutamine synthetase
VYLGDQLEKVYQDIKAGKLATTTEGGLMDLGLSQILKFDRDPGDRNRTSPFAFTGNRFEFRAVGSSQSVSGPLVAMNTMLADSLNWIAGKLEAELKKKGDRATAVFAVLKEIMDLHGDVVFGGNGYSPEWHKMAVEERGLKNLPTSADALPVLREEYIKQLFESTGVLSRVELESRFDVYAEQYILSIEVEAKLVIDMAKTAIYPAALQYLSDIAKTSSEMAHMKIQLDSSVAKTVAAEANSMMSAVGKLSDAIKQHDFASTEAHMNHCAHVILGLMNEVRLHADALEMEVADDLWPFPKYSEMLFIK